MGTGGLRVGMVGFLGGGGGGAVFGGEGALVVVVVVDGVVVGVLLGVTGGLAVVVVLFWSASGILLLLLGVVFPGLGGSISTLGIAKWTTKCIYQTYSILRHTEDNFTAFLSRRKDNRDCKESTDQIMLFYTFNINNIDVIMRSCGFNLGTCFFPKLNRKLVQNIS